MTDRLYYNDSHRKEFEAKVLDCRPVKDKYEVVLDRTAFFPEGGGQYADTGYLDDVEVLDVKEREDVIFHTTAAPLDTGRTVAGRIDWEQRFDRMQQHTGEHILSGLVHRFYGYENVGFHMGAEEVTVDFNGMITADGLDRLEDAANQIVYDNVPVHTLYPAKEELASIDYRSKKELSGQVRIIEIPGGDVCACCGTHVENTGEVGIIKIRGMIHYKGGVRISMLCGRRALLDYRNRLKDGIRLSNLLSARLQLVPEAVEKLKNDCQDREMLIGRLYGQLFGLKAGQYPKSNRPLTLFEEGLNMVQIRQLCTLLYEQEKGSVVMVCSGNEAQGEYQYALGSSLMDMRALSKAMNGKLHGRGGGSSLMAQGTFRASRQSVMDVFQEETKS